MPKRRTTREMELFRRHLIAMARELFIEQGVEAVSIRKIAERAGCPPMTFYVYFRNKLELLRHIWDDVLMAAAEAAEAAAATKDDPAAALEAYALAWCGYWLDNPDNYRMVFLYEDKLNTPEPADYKGPFNFILGAYYNREKVFSAVDLGFFQDIDVNFDGSLDFRSSVLDQARTS